MSVSFTIKKHAIHQSIRQPFDQEIDDCHGKIDGYQQVLRLQDKGVTDIVDGVEIVKQ
jgi:hypothetical protein